jgi:uncharacterized protein (DUF983 family)
MENSSEQLMATGTTGFCNDCGDERLFVMVAEGEHCCTTCDAAVFEVQVRPMRRWSDRAAQVSRPA